MKTNKTLILCLLLISILHTTTANLSLAYLLNSGIQSKTCDGCKKIEKAIGYLGETGVTMSLISKRLTCKIMIGVLKMNFLTVDSCVHLIDQMKLVPAVVIKQLFLKNSGFLCHLIVGICKAEESSMHWFNSNSYIAKIMLEPKINEESKVQGLSSRGSAKILHFSDVHLKLKYREGASTERGGFGACENDPVHQGEHLAKKFGDPACDLPTLTFETFLDQASKDQPDIIIYTGDNNDHNLLNYKNKNSFVETSYIAKRLRETFPDASIIPTLGNIESAPQDHQYDHLESTLNWALEGVSEAYSQLLYEEEKKSLGTKGYFSREIPQHNLRIVSLFSALYDPLNFFQIVRTFNPNSIFDFIWQELRIAESRNQKVIFISHAPTGESMNAQFSKIFEAFMSRYKDTVIAHFAGHTHRDNLSFYSNFMGHVTVPMFTVASISPINSGMPSYRVWSYDTDKGQLIDYDQFKFDLNKANDQNDSEGCWSKSYSFKSAYGISSTELTYDVLKNLYESLKNNNHSVLGVYESLRTQYSTKPISLKPDQIKLKSCRLHANIRQVARCLKLASEPIGGITSKLALMYRDYIVIN